MIGGRTDFNSPYCAFLQLFDMQSYIVPLQTRVFCPSHPCSCRPLSQKCPFAQCARILHSVQKGIELGHRCCTALYKKDRQCWTTSVRCSWHVVTCQTMQALEQHLTLSNLK